MSKGRLPLFAVVIACTFGLVLFYQFQTSQPTPTLSPGGSGGAPTILQQKIETLVDEITTLRKELSKKKDGQSINRAAEVDVSAVADRVTSELRSQLLNGILEEVMSVAGKTNESIANALLPLLQNISSVQQTLIKKPATDAAAASTQNTAQQAAAATNAGGDGDALEKVAGVRLLDLVKQLRELQKNPQRNTPDGQPQLVSLALLKGGKLHEFSLHNMTDDDAVLTLTAGEVFKSQDVDYMVPPHKHKELLTKPIKIGVMTEHFFGGDFVRRITGCYHRGELLDCEYTRQDTQHADALWYHAPHFSGVPQRQSSNQLLIIFSMEPEAYYPHLGRASFLKNFDIKFFYRGDSEIPLLQHYIGIPDIFRQTPSWDQREKALIMVQRNCNSRSGRENVFRELQRLSAQGVLKIPVKSMGGCLRTDPFPQEFMNDPSYVGQKGKLFEKFAFCFTMENSLVHDYVSEKVWDGLGAGCVPIYWGSDDIENHVPQPNSVINYERLKSPEKLAEAINDIVAHPEKYEEMFQWKKVNYTDAEERKKKLTLGFQKLIEMDIYQPSQHVHHCLVCRYAAEHRLRPNCKDCLHLKFE